MSQARLALPQKLDQGYPDAPVKEEVPSTREEEEAK